MSVIIWFIVALGLVALAIVAAALQTRRLAPPIELPPGESMPTRPLQRLVRWSLALGALLLVIGIVILVRAGPIEAFDDDTTRLALELLFVAALAILAIPTLVAGGWATRDDGRLDERERIIVARAPAGQAAAMLVVLAAWWIGLTETYRDAPGIPPESLTLMVWSCLLVSLVASNAGILLGYRRS
jgi:drug/metabolite transporter (DMT)-like permease